MKYEIIALDIDGTLLNMNQDIMPITKAINCCFVKWKRYNKSFRDR